ncbi:TonB-dependent receptor [Chryseolinea lacunae]|uniref:TonB-dependent receptor n=1 Tax=Chryseolinea lacunae TaxID=2801331 RepID=A0ABS1L0C9_9BACT|nr:TonB-dependent receptor [Chryseolinea lacunae]MBL0744968.1 TonB-dependent receptor [Chryseolinea lacunae]
MRFALFGLLILIGNHLYGQGQPALHGTVTANGGEVPFVSVAVLHTHLGTRTDSLGRFHFQQLSPGTYTLQFSGVGYITQKKEVTVAANAPTTLNVDLQEDVSRLDEVVVTGTMREVTKMNSPIPVEVYSPTFFMKNQTPNIFESLSMVNGVQPQVNCNVCNTGDIHINGLEGPYTMILIDGMPIVSSLSTVYGLAGIPNSLVKRMEIVKGPASTLYGSEAVGGVINIITKDPQTAPKLQVDAFGTSIGEYNLDVSGSRQWKFASSLVGVNAFDYWQKRDINHDNFTDATLQRRISVFNKWRFNRPSAKNASIAGRYIYENRWGGELQWTPAYRGSNVYYGESIHTERVEVLGNYEWNTVPGLQIDMSYNHHYQDSYYGVVKYAATQEVGFVQARWSKQLGHHDLLAGLPLRYQFYDDNTVGTTASDGANKPNTTVLPGIFVQDEIAITKRFTTLLGARYDRHNIHGNIYTPRLSFKYSPNANNTIRLTGGSGYRVVNLFTEDHAALTGARSVEILHDLKPEQSWNANLNYARNLILPNGFVSLDASLFYTYFNNKIVADYNTDPNKIIYDNLNGHAISKGLTFNADVALNNGLKFITGVTWMDVFRMETKNNEATKIPQQHAPRFSGTFTVSYQHAPSGLLFDLTGRVNGPMHLPVVPNDYRPEMSPWYALVNLQVTKTLNNNLEIYAGVKNLLNFKPKDPLLRPFDPFDQHIGEDNPYGYTFDTTYNYAPMQGMRGQLGVRWTVQ